MTIREGTSVSKLDRRIVAGADPVGTTPRSCPQRYDQSERRPAPGSGHPQRGYGPAAASEPWLCATHSHLFPGAILRVEPAAGSRLQAGPITVRFSDGINAVAEILDQTTTNGRVLVVPTYTTAAGNAVSSAVWLLISIPERHPDDAVKVGRKLPISRHLPIIATPPDPMPASSDSTGRQTPAGGAPGDQTGRRI